MSADRNEQIKTLFRELKDNRPIDVFTNKPVSIEGIFFELGQRFSLSPDAIRNIVRKKQ